MNRARTLLNFLLLTICCLQRATASEAIKEYFSPRGGCTHAVVDTLAGAKTYVYVAAYSFTSAPIPKLTDALKRGAKVSVIFSTMS